LAPARLVDRTGVARSGRRPRGGPRARDRAPAKHWRAAAERADHNRGCRAARARRGGGGRGRMTLALFGVLLLAGTAAVVAPVRTLVAAALIAAVAVAVAVFYLPPSAGDRAPGETVTGTVPQTDAIAALEARASANASDLPTQLALADAYVHAGRPEDAIPRYRAVLARDPN